MSTKRRELDGSVSAEDLALARKFGVTDIQMSEGRWRPILRAVESHELALEGDERLLDQRLQAGCAGHAEQGLIADLRAGRLKPRKKKLSQLLAQDKRQLIAEFILKREREDRGINRESFVQEAMDHFKVARSEVFTSLKLYESN